MGKSWEERVSFSFTTSSFLVASSDGLQPNSDGLPLVASLEDVTW